MPDTEPLFIRPWILAVLTLAVAPILYWLCWQVVPVITPAATGTTLDTPTRINAAGALFSALTFVALIYTVLLQRHELALQRQEIALTRVEIRGQRRELERQANELGAQRELMTQQVVTMRRQAFENTLFQLLRQHNELVQTQRLTVGNSTFDGRTAFEWAASSLVDALADVAHNPTFACSARTMNELFASTCEAHASDFSAFSRNLYYILRFIDESAIENATLYSQMVRAQLSQSELVLLAFNGLRNNGTSRLKTILEKHHLLNNLPDTEWVRHLHPLYERSAFGSAAA